MEAKGVMAVMLEKIVGGHSLESISLSMKDMVVSFLARLKNQVRASNLSCKCSYNCFVKKIFSLGFTYFYWKRVQCLEPVFDAAVYEREFFKNWSSKQSRLM